MEGKDYKTDQNCFPLARALALLLLLISGSLALSIYLSIYLSLSSLTDLAHVYYLRRGDLLLQENKHFIIIIWTQSCLLLSEMFVRKKLPQQFGVR